MARKIYEDSTENIRILLHIFWEVVFIFDDITW